jgi:DNA-binding transcriptional ArsR family regulator
MSSDSSGNGFSVDRAEIFEALGHPTRIKILELLSSSSQGFSELKKALGIESSGLLQFHLSKLQGLVKAGSDGNYALTDEGKEALRISATRTPKLGLFARFVFIFSVVVSVTDIVVFYHIMKNPGELTWSLVALIIIATMVPIVISLWFWLVYKDTKWKHILPWDK